MHIQSTLIDEGRFASGNFVNHIAALLCRGVPAICSLHGMEGRGYSINSLQVIHNHE